MPLSETLQDLATDIIPDSDTENFDGKQQLREAGFSDDVIDELWDDLISRFETALPIYARGIEWNLALREALSLQHVEAWEATAEQVSTALEAFIAEHPHNISGHIEAGANTIRERARTQATSQVEQQIQQRPLLWWIANIMNIEASDIVDYGVERASGNAASFSLIGLVFVFLGFRNSTIFQDYLDSTDTPTPTNSEDWEIPADRETPDEWDTDEAPAEWREITVEDEKFIFYSSGANLIIGLNGVRENTNISADNILRWLKDTPFNEISSLTETQRSELMWDVEEGESDLLDEIFTSLTSDTTETLLRVGLTASSISNTLDPDGDGTVNEWLEIYFGETAQAGRERLQQILEASQTPNFNWRELTFWEISQLYISSIPALRIPAVRALWEWFWEVRSFFGDGVINEDYPENMYILPRHILEGFWTGMANNVLTNEYINSSNADVTRLVLWESPSESDIEIMERIFAVKDYLQSPEFLTSDKLWLSPEQRDLFTRNLDYAGVLSLYAILWGIPDINSVNTVSLPILLFAVSKIIWSWNNTESYQGTLYLWNYIREVFLSGDSRGLSDDEMDVMRIYGRRLLDAIVLSHLDGIYRTLWLATWVTGLDLTELWLATAGAGFISNRVWAGLIRRWINGWRLSLTWTLFRRAWLIGMVAWGLIWGAWLLLDDDANSLFTRDLESAAEHADSTGDISRFLEVLERHKESFQTFTDSNGESLVVSAYPWETPFVVYNRKVYTFNLWSANLEDSARENWASIWNDWDFSGIPGALAGLVGAQATGIVDWVDFRIRRYEDWNIIFWEWENPEDTYTIPLSELLSLQEQDSWVVGNDFINRITDWEHMIPWIGNEWQPWYVLNMVWPNHVLYLMEVWEIWDAVVS